MWFVGYYSVINSIGNNKNTVKKRCGLSKAIQPFSQCDTNVILHIFSCTLVWLTFAYYEIIIIFFFFLVTYFETVDHTILIDALRERFGVDGDALNY